MGPRLHMRHLSCLISASCSWLVAAGTVPAESLAKNRVPDIQPILERYCHDCHADGVEKGGISLDGHRDTAALLADRDLWERVRKQVDFRLMPPPDEDAPDDEERRKILTWIDAEVFPVDPENLDPGHVTLRRLNRNEYRNTLRDLLGVTIDVNAILPPDDSGYGFDNIGDALSLSPTHVERFFDAAETALDIAIRVGPMPRERQTASGERLQGDGQPRDAGRYLLTDGTVRATFKVPRPGQYRVEITAAGTRGADEDPVMDFSSGGQSLRTWKVPARLAAPEAYSHEWHVGHDGDLQANVAFTNDFYDETSADPERRDRNLWIGKIELIGPLDGPPPPKPPTHHRIFGDPPGDMNPAAYATRVIAPFAKRAFRRTVTKEEIMVFRDLALERANGDIERGIRDALLAVLVSPSFLYREEPDAASPAGGRVLVSEFALASRLSYFLWGSMPDDHLLEQAAAGRLRENLDPEIKRMLASGKSNSLVRDFAGQWLQFRDLDVLAPDAKRFPSFNRGLAEDMRTETERFVAHVLSENLPLNTLLDADFTFLNESLAKHYGYPGVRGPEFRKVPLASPRRGILGHASILTLTSYPTRTSPVIRGRYILENILNTPPPPPPQNVPPLEADKDHASNLPLRRQLERHREDPACSSCHALMDPLGFGLENFDAIGRWRDSENRHPIDPSGTLADGASFSGPAELLDILSKDAQDRFLRSAASKMLTYALGRGVQYYDRTTIDRIVSTVKQDDRRMHSLIRAIVHSVPFQYRRKPS